ncbi:hypothetical protein ASPVEDRAFT_155927 [Aspergillus versicolor CBS 583.65]|uniref:Uncharacterized protein n=1 Tax=Aspergillus versicolor CBS 583.65 TaxID=1036611 RepID=A0A1L9Q3B7_ASPVE|nr:uncharacterized protein ASPVEDRAFT_155927 [Aspergillus versicolor CBS 583.65]OJJ08226.1 hypothetical protein ASPVEDRAFT_155927 [Aspergillus versicolor CBS 583.65]
MHFSKVISVTLFAVLATASPVPAEISIDQAQIAAVAESFNNFAGSTDGAASDLSGQLQALGAGGASAENIAQWSAEFQQKAKELVQISQEISSGLSQSGQSFEQAESDAASNFDKLASALGGN